MSNRQFSISGFINETPKHYSYQVHTDWRFIKGWPVCHDTMWTIPLRTVDADSKTRACSCISDEFPIADRMYKSVFMPPKWELLNLLQVDHFKMAVKCRFENVPRWLQNCLKQN